MSIGTSMARLGRGEQLSYSLTFSLLSRSGLASFIVITKVFLICEMQHSRACLERLPHWSKKSLWRQVVFGDRFHVIQYRANCHEYVILQDTWDRQSLKTSFTVPGKWLSIQALPKTLVVSSYGSSPRWSRNILFCNIFPLMSSFILTIVTLLMFNRNMGPITYITRLLLWGIRLPILGDLSRSFKVKCDSHSAFGLPIYGFLLMFNSNTGPE